MRTWSPTNSVGSRATGPGVAWDPLLPLKVEDDVSYVLKAVVASGGAIWVLTSPGRNLWEEGKWFA